MQAIILAGGLGTRLRPMIRDIPKPMADIAGRPFLCWLLEYMQEQGVREATLCVHHRRDAIIGYFKDRFAGIRLSYCVEDQPLGTGGAIRRALTAMQPKGPVLVLNGDSLVDVDYTVMLALHQRNSRQITMATRWVSDCSRYSELTLSDDTVTHYALLGENAPGLISAGFYVVSPRLFDGYELPQAFSLERDFLARYASALQPAAYRQTHYFIDIGVPSDYIRAQVEIPELRMRAIAA